MEVAKGKLIDIIDVYHILFETDKEKVWLGVIQQFGLNLIGKDFISNMIPRYDCLSLVENVDGQFKLIDYKRCTGGLCEFVTNLYFKEYKTGRLIEATKVIENLKPFNLGTNYDLGLIETYKGLNPLPNLKENKTKDNELVYILNKTNEANGVGFYLVQWGNKTISLHGFSTIDQYLGKSVLIQLFRKKLGRQTYYFDNINEIVSLPQSNILFDSSLRGNLLCVKENQQTLIQTESLIYSYESGANIDMQYLPVYMIKNPSFKKSTKNNGYLLSMIINYNKKPNYLFINSADNTDKRLVYFPVDLDLENAIGQYFTFESFPLFSAIEVSALSDTDDISRNYLLKTILTNDFYIFSENDQQYYVSISGFEISSSKTGKPFLLKLIPVLREIVILDFESAY